MAKKSLPMPSIIPGKRRRRMAARAGCWLMLAAGPAASLTAQSAISPVLTGPMRALQDGRGVVWAWEFMSGQQLFQWRQGQWRTAETDRGAAIQRISRGARGGVVVDWNKNGGSELYWYRGGKIRDLGALPARCILRASFGAGNSTYLICASRFLYWYGTGRLPFSRALEIYRARPGKKPRLVFRSSPREMFPASGAPGMLPNYLRLHVTRAADGSRWLWAGMIGWRPTARQLRGFLVLRRGKFTYHARIPGLPGLRLAAMGPWDRHHLAVATLGGGLYRLNTHTLRARAMPSPQPGAFRLVQKIMRAGRWHIVIAAAGPQAGFRTRHGVVWVGGRRGWRERLAGLDIIRPITLLHGRPVLAQRRGIWLGSFNNGLWFLPRKGRAQRINWRQGFPLPTVSAIFRLRSRQLLTVDDAGRAAVIPLSLTGIPQPPHHTPSISLHAWSKTSQLHELHGLMGLQSDGRGHIWSIFISRHPQLAEWSGSRWIKHAFPEGIFSSWLGGLNADQEGRIWLLPSCRIGMPMAIFNPGQQKWRSFGNYYSALESIPGPVFMLHPRTIRPAPVYGPGHQIAFLGRCLGINYYNGRRWRLWNRPQWPNRRGWPVSGPFFDAQGHLAINFRKSQLFSSAITTWQWCGATGWKSIPRQNAPVIQSTLAPRLAPPAIAPGCLKRATTSSIQDAYGRDWSTTPQGGLWISGAGKCIPVLSSHEDQPFLDGRFLVHVLLDANGGAWLRTRTAGIFQYVYLSAARPSSLIQIQGRPLTPSGFKVRWSGNAAQYYSWRLDHGPWRPISPKQQHRWRVLPGGSHRLEVVGFNARLRALPHPAVFQFQTQAPSQQQLAGLLAQLAQAHGDAERQQLVKELLRLPAAQLIPRLRSALRHAPPSERWWLGLALRQARRKAAARP